jgi:hypothetical protein
LSFNYPSQTIEKSGYEIQVEHKNGYAECRIWVISDHEWTPTDRVVKIDLADLIRLSNALDVLKDQGNKATQEGKEWDRRFKEISALFEKEHKQFQDSITEVCSQLPVLERSDE